MTTITLHKYLQQIEDLIEEHNIDEAVNHCRHILQQHPRHVETYRTLAKAYLERGDYQDAVDLIQRVLSTNPADFIAHVALSIAYKELSQFDQSIWHLERALDVEPYNAPLREELVELYSLNKAAVPESMAPTSAALARMYLQSEMYNAAISELRKSLETEPDRIDLKVQLAETLWWANHRVEAVSVALEILDVLPNCIPVNALLAEIWLQTGRIAEAQSYMKRLQALTLLDETNCDPETAVGRAFLTRGAPTLPQQMEITYLGEEPISEIEAEPEPVAPIESDWINEFTIEESEEPPVDMEEEEEPDIDDWLGEAALADGETFGTQPLVMPSDPLEEETEWFVDPGDEEESLDELIGDIGGDAQLDDWLTSLDSDVLDDADVEPEREESTGFTGMLTGLIDSDFDAPEETADAADLADLFEEAGETPADEAIRSAEMGDEALELDDLLTDGDDDAWTDLAADESVPEEESFAEGLTMLFSDMADDEKPEEAPLDVSEELDFAEFDETDLGALAESAPPAPEEPSGFTELFGELSDPEAQDEPEALESDWLAPQDESVEAEDEVSEEPEVEDEPTGFTALFDELSTEAFPDEVETVDSDWLSPAEDEEVSDVSEPEAAETAVDDEHTGFTHLFDEMSTDAYPDESQELGADWLSPAAEEPVDAADVGAEDGTDDWLAELAGETDTAVPDEQPDESEPDSKMPTWMLGGEQEAGQVETPAPIDFAESVGFDTDELKDDTAIPTWLLGGDLTSEDTGALDDLSKSDAEVTDTGLLRENPQTILAGEELPDWLDDSQQDEPETAVPAPIEPESESDSVHEELPGWLSGDASISEEPEHLPSDPLATDSMAELAGEEIPSWLMDDEPEIEAQPIPEPDSDLDLYKDDLNIPDWLMSDLATDQDQAEVPVIGDKDEQEPITPPEPEETPASSEELDDDLGWLTGLTEDDDNAFQDEDDSVSYASRVAAGEGGAVEEPPTQVSMPDELPDAFDLADETLESDMALADGPAGEDIEDVLAGVTGELNADLDWLDSLAEESESPLDDLHDPITEIDSGTDWLDDLAIAGDTGPLDGLGDEPILPDFDDSLAILPDESEDSPGWLAELDSEPEPVAEPEDDLVEAADIADEDAGISWLDEFTTDPEADDLGALDFMDGGVSEEEVAESIDDLLDIMEPEGEEPVEVQAELEDEVISEPAESLDEVPEDMEDAMAWLEELAAGQGAPLEELPSLSDDLATDPGVGPEDEAVTIEPDDAGLETDFSAIVEPESADEEDVPEDIEDAMAWLESLAAKQGARIEELPSMADADEIELDTDTAVPDETDDSLEWLEELTEEPIDDMAVPLPLDLGEDEMESVDTSLDWLEDMAEEEEPVVAAEEEAEEATEEEPEIDPSAAVPENMDEAMVWLEALAVEQGAPAEELPSVTEDTAVTESEPTPEPESEPEPISADEPADLDDAMGWLEDLAAEQDTPLEDLPTIAGVVDEDLFVEPAEEAAKPALAEAPSDELAEALDYLEQLALEEGAELPQVVDDERTAATTKDELSATLDWLEQLALADEKPDVETAEVDELASITDEMPEDPDEALAWLQKVAAEQEQVEDHAEEIDVALETAVDLSPITDEALEEIFEPEPEIEAGIETEFDLPAIIEEAEAEIPELEIEEDVATELDDAAPVVSPEVEAAATVEADTEESTEVDAGYLAEMPEDPDAAMAWLEQLAARQGADLEELPSVTEEDMQRIAQEPEPVAEADEDLSELLAEIEPEAPVDDAWLDDMAEDIEPLPEVLPEILDDEEAAGPDEPETDETGLPESDLAALDVPEDMDDAMAWLEALAAQQGADLEELPSLSGTGELSPEVLDEVEAETAVPDSVEEPVEAVDEPETPEEPFALEPEIEEDTTEIVEIDDSDDEIDLDEGIEEALPDWLDEDTGSLDELPGQTSWLRSLDEPDVSGWLEEEETTISTSHDQSVRSRFETTSEAPIDTGPLPSTDDLIPDTDSFSLPEDEFEPTVFALDDDKLAGARQAVEEGAFDDALQSYQELVDSGGGMMALIGDLENMITEYPERPLFRHLLGDAYMRNGQLQKALDTYRLALDQI